MKTAYGLLGIVFVLFVNLPRSSGAILCSANPSNLVANCGFETGTFAGWTLSGNDVPQTLDNLYGVEGIDPVDSTAPHSGNFQVFIADLDTNATTLSQTITTIVGDVYTISFYLAQDTLPTPEYSNEVLVSIAGMSLASLSAVPVEGYTLYSFTSNPVQTTSSVLKLTLGNGLGQFLLDDITVTGAPTPEPSAWMLTPLALAGFIFRRTRGGSRGIVD